MELASATGSSTSGPTPSNPGTPYVPSHEAGDTSGGSLGLDASPLVLPESESHAGLDVPELDLDRAAKAATQKSL